MCLCVYFSIFWLAKTEGKLLNYRLHLNWEWLILAGPQLLISLVQAHLRLGPPGGICKDGQYVYCDYCLGHVIITLAGWCQG